MLVLALSPVEKTVAAERSDRRATRVLRHDGWEEAYFST